jgi:polyisoprenoid-binding protein YceI
MFCDFIDVRGFHVRLTETVSKHRTDLEEFKSGAAREILLRFTWWQPGNILNRLCVLIVMWFALHHKANLALASTKGPMKTIARCLLWLVCSTIFAFGTDKFRFDSTNAVVQVHVGTSGAFGFLGHGHLMQAPIQLGTLVYHPDDPGQTSVELAVDATSLQVVDPELSVGDRKKILTTMQSERVLGVKEYPTISFKSTMVEPERDHQLIIHGNLTIRDKTKQVIVHANLEQVGPAWNAAGQCQFKQTEFGIRPVTAGLGTVKVQDQVTITFQVVARQAQESK